MRPTIADLVLRIASGLPLATEAETMRWAARQIARAISKDARDDREYRELTGIDELGAGDA